jgi:hypothetical protein
MGTIFGEAKDAHWSRIATRGNNAAPDVRMDQEFPRALRDKDPRKTITLQQTTLTAPVRVVRIQTNSLTSQPPPTPKGPHLLATHGLLFGIVTDQMRGQNNGTKEGV